MGMFDTFDVDDCDGQVKCYGRLMDFYEIGDKVNNKNLPISHSIKLRHGMWINVANNIYISYTKSPLFGDTFDKWARSIDTDFNYED